MIGERIGDRYVVLDSIGGGGMANVYLALDVILDRHVAVKVLQPQFSKDEQFIKRFRREAQAATSLNNPHIVNIFDVGEEEDLYYIVMEYVKGRTLKEVIQEDGPLDIATALDYFKQILHGVGHAHAMQIVHRDMKPQNILISEDGEAKVTDFGIARAMTSTTITHTNSVMGSVHYLSPEQARGGHVTYRSDLYSLGIVLFEMVTGRIPFSGDTAVSIAIKHLQNEIPSARELVSSIPQSVEDIIKKATMKDPNQRFNSAEDVIWACDMALDPNQSLQLHTQLEDDDEEKTKELPIVAGFTNNEDQDKTIEIPVQKQDDVPVETAKQEDQKKEAEQTKKPAKKKKKWLWISIIGIGVIIGAFILALTLWSEVFFVEETTIPDVEGMEENEAIEEIESQRLIANVEPISTDEYEPGQVANQSPRAGRTVKEGSEVTLYVVASREEVTLDDYSGYTFTQAERLLEQLGFEVEEQSREDNSAQEGTVISQSPSNGSSVVPADTTVVLTVAVPETIQLDDLVNQTEEDVRAYFNAEGLRGTFEREHDEDIPAGRVIRQSPEPLTTMEQGDRVEIVLSRGPEPSEPDETPEVPQQPEGEVEDPVAADPVEDPTEEEEPSSVYRITQTVVVSEEHQSEERSFAVRIVATDANSQGDERVVVEETITTSTDFTIDLRVSPSYPGSYEVFIDDEFNRESDVYEYEE
ncbi:MULTISPECIES: Stk1 family PASTA domain-containing Ser/Thr kinase [Shouchella]|uniref:non-specific serine/threonine protein kinase n=1 Tax=Shouchella hunanensis TaxID=766894 RepID=A0ABY7W5W7_9BACI|nr:MULTISPECIES: Stk1 family PASTA domain-containing Ser/Thr kinase [Shouchella]WDF03819.1 Stk1 family PASTA domain-containing Ser/Thr kinase [Shouchella hunanensis]